MAFEEQLVKLFENGKISLMEVRWVVVILSKVYEPSHMIV